MGGIRHFVGGQDGIWILIEWWTWLILTLEWPWMLQVSMCDYTLYAPIPFCCRGFGVGLGGRKKNTLTGYDWITRVLFLCLEGPPKWKTKDFRNRIGSFTTLRAPICFFSREPPRTSSRKDWYILSLSSTEQSHLVITNEGPLPYLPFIDEVFTPSKPPYRLWFLWDKSSPRTRWGQVGAHVTPPVSGVK